MNAGLPQSDAAASRSPIDDPAVVIGGLHRSGTSLMRGLLGSHPSLAIWPNDLPFWRQLYKRHRDRDFGDPADRAALVDAVLAEPKYESVAPGFDRSDILAELAGHNHVDCGVVFAAFFRRYAIQVGRPRWGVKTPFNEFYAAAIFASYPNARMIQLLRDPRDVACSIQSRGWRWDPARFCKHWRKSADRARQFMALHPDAYLCVRYEDLVREPVATMRRVCAVVNLDVHDDMFGMRGQTGWQGSNSFFDDVGRRRQPEGITPRAVGRFRERLPAGDREWLENALGEAMSEWGYT